MISQGSETAFGVNLNIERSHVTGAPNTIIEFAVELLFDRFTSSILPVIDAVFMINVPDVVPPHICA